MELFSQAIDVVFHLGKYLDALVAFLGGWTYLVLFLIIFLETGIVVTPFLPGDSLLFAAGAVAARGGVDIIPLMVVIFSASVLGDMANYSIGKFSGSALLSRYPRLIKQEHLDKTHTFFERYGAKTIVLCRFVPIVRTVAPFVAGAGAMTYRKFMRYNIVGGALWTLSLTLAGYFFGSVPFVEENFSLVLVAIVGVSFIPPVVEYIRERRRFAVASSARGDEMQ